MTVERRPRFSLRWFLALFFIAPVCFILGINLMITLPPLPAVPSEGETVAYFAYGSNMNNRYFTRIRGITRVSSEIASLPGYAVRFNLDGIAVLEPSFANLSAEEGATAYGILHHLPTGEFSKIIGSEGDSYNVHEVTVFRRDGSTVTARTLISDPSLDIPETPSRRYLGYMHEAAQTYDMPPEVIERYNPANGAYVPVVSELFGVAMHTMVWITARL